MGFKTAGFPKFGFNPFGFSKSIGGSAVDPRIQAAIDAGATLLLMGDLADGNGPGNNTDPTSVWKDQSGSGNDATAVNFAWTSTSGWDDVTVPKGTESMLNGDAVDDYLTITDDPSIDPTGLEEFALCGVIKIAPVLATNQYLFAKNLDTSASMQIGILIRSTGQFSVLLNGLSFSSPTGVLAVNGIYSFAIKRIDGRLKITINLVSQLDVANTTSLISRPNVSLLRRSASVDGTTGSFFCDHLIGYLALYYNGATGLNETDVDNACALLRAPYF